jgi:putative ABC transport system permease protein
MSLQRKLRRGLRVLLRRAAADSELREELQHYYEEEVTALMARGLTRAQATREVRLRLGDPGNVVEDVRVHGWEHLLDAVMTDVRHAVRRLHNSPSFTLASVLTLGLGMGASTAIFSAVKPILFDALPYEAADRIVMVWDRMQDGSALDVTFGTYREIVQRSRSFAALATLKLWQPTLTGGAEPERLEGQRVGADYFQVLGVQPALGRDFSEEEDRARGPNVVMLSHGLWQRRFGSDPGIIGRAITLSDNPFTVIGVLPSALENVLSPAAEVWAPLQYDAALPADGREWGHHLRMVGRLNDSVDLAMARRELDRIGQTPLPQFVRVPWASMSGGMMVSSLQDDLTRGVRPALLAVIGAVLLLLGIACVNVTNLLLVRGSQRGGELALRAALGAGRDRLIAQLVMETMLLALLGAVAGLGVARLGVRALVALSPPELPRVSAIGIDAGVLVFAFGSATLIGLAVGMFVALHVARRQPGVVVQRRSVRVAGGDQHARRVLVVAQVALAVVLLVSGGLLLRSLQRLFAVDPGFDARQVLTMQVQTASRRFEADDETRRFFAQALDAVRAVPGVSSAALTSQLPLSGDFQKYGLHLESAPALDPRADGSGFRYAVTPDYFRTMLIPLRHGRLLDERDRLDAPPVVVINESFARRRFAGTDPIGQRIRVGSMDQPWATIVGVVADVHQASLALTQENAVYVPTTQGYFADRTLWLVVRTKGEPAALATPIRDAIWSVDRDQPISRVATMDELVRRSAAERRFTLVIFNAFALAALLLSAIGLYGVLAAMVTARLREIGVRAALGASRRNILGLIVGYGVTLTTAGLVLGMTGALAAARVLRSLLFGVSELDPLTYAGVLLLILAVGVAACCLPALRASRVEPSIALRVD